MSYYIIQPPFTLKFKTMSKKELKAYHAWFMNSISERIHELTDEVRSSEGCKSWQPDYSPASLDSIGDWMVTQAETRKRTANEIDEIKKNCSFEIDVPEWELTNRTFSLTMDIGMYLARVFEHNHRNVSWDQPLKNKNYIDYGQPVLVGFGNLTLNPVQIVSTIFYKISKGKGDGHQLRDTYDLWTQYIESPVNKS